MEDNNISEEMAELHIEIPRPHIMIWEHLSYTDTLKISSIFQTTNSTPCSELAALYRYLSEILDLQDYDKDKKKRIQLDLYYFGIKFCLEKIFNAEQISAFYSILKALHFMTISTPYDNLEQTYTYFRDLIACHSVNHIPFSTAVFTSAQVTLITDYIMMTYFAHFRLYKYVFTKKISLHFKILNNMPQETEHAITVEEQTLGIESEDNSARELEEIVTEPEIELAPKEQNLANDVSKSLNSQITNLKQDFAQQMKTRDESIDKKLVALEKSIQQLTETKK